MELCSSGHEEICFTERYCPLCGMMDENEHLNAQIEDLEEERNNLQEQIEELQQLLKVKTNE